MRALVLYESMYGNTRAIAGEVAAGLTGFDVTVLPVGAVTPATLDGVDLLVVGAPTHAFGLSRPQTRVAAERQAAQSRGAFVLEPGATGPGVREWLDALPRGHRAVAVFDTRIRGAGFAGHAAPRIAKQLRAKGHYVIDSPRSFFVTRRNVLVGGELADARAWGQALSALIGSAYPTIGHQAAGS